MTKIHLFFSALLLVTTLLPPKSFNAKGGCKPIEPALITPPDSSVINHNSTFTLLAKIPLEAGTFTTDNLQNIYVYAHSYLRKYDARGSLLYTYDDRTYGDISWVDVTDPLKVMVFYKDFPEVVFLDNTLSLNGTSIGPSDLGFPLTTLACISHDNGAWLFDAQNLQLVRLDMNLNVTQKTGNLLEALGFPINPNCLLEYNNYVYMNDSAHGILVFDAFGTYDKTIPVHSLTTFEVRGDDLFYVKSDLMHIFHLKIITEDATALPEKPVQIARVERNLLFESCRDSVRVYKIAD